MKNIAAAGVLPVGITDVLPPRAGLEDRAQAVVLNVFQRAGYETVSPPLAEFEETLLPETHGELATDTFRVVDVLCGKTMGIRADMTPQIARIASTRLKDEPRPLRLTYHGHVLRVNAKELDVARQVSQVGAELIGADCADADAEIILLTAQALKDIGVENFSFDLTLPTLLPALCSEFEIDGEIRMSLCDALNAKDFSKVCSLLKNGGRSAQRAFPVFEKLLPAFGDGDKVVSVLDDICFSGEAAAEINRLKEVFLMLKRETPDLKVTVDILENRGFEYHKGIAFSVFARDGVRELGRGGRYISGLCGAAAEPACGVTLFMAAVMPLLKMPKREKRVYAPFGTSYVQMRDVREKECVVVRGMSPATDVNEEARRLSCGYVLSNGKIVPV